MAGFTDEDRAKAAAAKARLAEERRSDPAARVRQNLPGLFDALLDAAFGRGKYGGKVEVTCPECSHKHMVGTPKLPPDKRLTALFRALEYGAGRPVSLDKTPAGKPEPEPDDETEEPSEGLSIE